MSAINTNKVLRYLQCSSALGKRAMDERNKLAEAEKQAQAAIPGVLDTLLENQAIGPTQKEAAAKLLATHTGTLDLLKSAAARIKQLTSDTTKQAGDRMGHGVDGQEGMEDADRSLTSPFVGARTTVKKASDVRLLQGLGIYR